MVSVRATATSVLIISIKKVWVVVNSLRLTDFGNLLRKSLPKCVLVFFLRWLNILGVWCFLNERPKISPPLWRQKSTERGNSQWWSCSLTLGLAWSLGENYFIGSFSVLETSLFTTLNLPAWVLLRFAAIFGKLIIFIQTKGWPYFEFRRHLIANHGICLPDDMVIENLTVDET